MLFIGTAVGIGVNKYTRRPIPQVSILDVSLSPISEAISVKVPVEMVIASQKTVWADTLSNEMSLSDLSDAHTSISEINSTLDKIPSEVTRLITMASAPAPEDVQRKNFQKYFLDMDKDVSSAIVSSIHGGLNRKEIDLRLIDISPSEFDEDPDAIIIADEILSAVLIRYFAISSSWNQTIMLKMLKYVEKSMPGQYNDNLKLESMIGNFLTVRSERKRKLFMEANLIFSNHGQSTITFDKFSTLKASEQEGIFFMEAIDFVGGIAVPPGETKTVEFRTVSALNEEQSELYKTLYAKNILKIFAVTRLLTKSDLRDEWVISQEASLGGNQIELEKLYKDTIEILGF